MKLSYYPGCTLKNHARNFDDTTFSVMDRLNVEVEELSRWNCCGTVHSLASDNIMNRMAPIRNLIRAKEEGADKLMTVCSMCYNTLKRANDHVSADSEVKDRLNDFMYMEKVDYEGDVNVFHMLEFLRDEIGFKDLASRVEKPLEGLKVACYYGCMLVRPKEVAFDDVENPTIMEDLITALGGTPVDFAMKTECCASYQTVDKPEIVAEQTAKIVGDADSKGADLVVVSCPLCAFNLDNRQEKTAEMFPDFNNMPVVYFTQLMAIALGCPDESLGLDLHHIDPNPVLADKGLL